MSRISRDDYLSIPSKNTSPDQRSFLLIGITPAIKIWPTPDNSTDILVFDVLTRLDDADKSTNTVDVPFRFYPCLAAGLAYYISMKRARQNTAFESFMKNS